MPVPLIIVAAIAVAGEVASTVEQKKAADAAASTATTVAGYNAAIDNEQATQVDLDTQQNIDNLRANAKTYMARQDAAYAGNGLIANTGSPLAVKAATAGKFAMQEQQMWNDSQAKEQMLASEGEAGIFEGDAQADQYHMQGVADVISGASKVASSLYGAYTGGAFSGLAGTGTNLVSAGLNSPSYGGGAADLAPIGAGSGGGASGLV